MYVHVFISILIQILKCTKILSLKWDPGFTHDRCHGKNSWQDQEVAIMGYFFVKVSFVKRSEELLTLFKNLLYIVKIFQYYSFLQGLFKSDSIWNKGRSEPIEEDLLNKGEFHTCTYKKAFKKKSGELCLINITVLHKCPVRI